MTLINNIIYDIVHYGSVHAIVLTKQNFKLCFFQIMNLENVDAKMNESHRFVAYQKYLLIMIMIIKCTYDINSQFHTKSNARVLIYYVFTVAIIY